MAREGKQYVIEGLLGFTAWHQLYKAGLLLFSALGDASIRNES